jgi:hypothetical protein
MSSFLRNSAKNSSSAPSSALNYELRNLATNPISAQVLQMQNLVFSRVNLKKTTSKANNQASSAFFIQVPQMSIKKIGFRLCFAWSHPSSADCQKYMQKKFKFYTCGTCANIGLAGNISSSVVVYPPSHY